MPGGDRQRNGNKYAEKLVLRVDGNIHIGAGMDAAARGEIAVDGNVGVAELQRDRVKVFAGEIADHVRAGNKCFVENDLCAQVDNLIRDDVLIFRYFNVDIPISLVESNLNIVLGIQIVFHDGGFQVSHRLVLAVGGEDDILCADGAEYINLLADYQKVQSSGVQTVDAQIAADGCAQVIGENEVGEEDAVFGCLDIQIVQIEVDDFIGDGFGLAFFFLDHSVLRLQCYHIVCEGLERINRVLVFQRDRALIEQRVGERLDVLEQYLKAFGKIQMQCIVSQVTQKDDLCQGIDGDFRSCGVNGNAFVFVKVVVELAGQMQAVVAGLVIDRDVGAAPCSKGSGGVCCNQVVSLTAVKGYAADGKGLAVQLAGDEVHRGLQEVLCEAEVTAAADAESVLAVAAVHDDIGRAHVHRETELTEGIAFRIGLEKRHDHIAGVDELDAAHILACAQLHIHIHSGRIA